MAFFLTPRFAPAYNSCSPFGCAPAPQRVVYRQSRPSFPSFVPFLSQVDELLSELDREARRRAAHQARQQRKRAFRAKFNVHENEQGWEVQGEVPGFEQENIQIEVSDEQTLKISGNTETRIEREAAPAPVEAAPAPEAEKAAEADTEMDGVTITEADLQEQERAASPAGSDTESNKSYQATVEDDFEDLGAETSSTVSAASEPKEPKGKEKAVEEPAAVQPAPQQEAPVEQQQQQQEEERFHGSFEQTFKFPVRIDTANVRAALKDGVLSVSVPKAPVHQIRQIAIQ